MPPLPKPQHFSTFINILAFDDIFNPAIQLLAIASNMALLYISGFTITCSATMYFWLLACGSYLPMITLVKIYYLASLGSFTIYFETAGIFVLSSFFKSILLWPVSALSSTIGFPLSVSAVIMLSVSYLMYKNIPLFPETFGKLKIFPATDLFFLTVHLFYISCNASLLLANPPVALFSFSIASIVLLSSYPPSNIKEIAKLQLLSLVVAPFTILFSTFTLSCLALSTVLYIGLRNAFWYLNAYDTFTNLTAPLWSFTQTCLYILRRLIPHIELFKLISNTLSTLRDNLTIDKRYTIRDALRENREYVSQFVQGCENNHYSAKFSARIIQHSLSFFPRNDEDLINGIFVYNPNNYLPLFMIDSLPPQKTQHITSVLIQSIDPTFTKYFILQYLALKTGLITCSDQHRSSLNKIKQFWKQKPPAKLIAKKVFKAILPKENIEALLTIQLCFQRLSITSGHALQGFFERDIVALIISHLCTSSIANGTNLRAIFNEAVFFFDPFPSRIIPIIARRADKLLLEAAEKELRKEVLDEFTLVSKTRLFNV